MNVISEQGVGSMRGGVAASERLVNEHHHAYVMDILTVLQGATTLGSAACEIPSEDKG